MGRVTINGETYHTSGNAISVVNGVITVDGMNVTPKDEKNIQINIIGDVGNLNVDHCNLIEIDGDVKDLQTSSGDVTLSGNVEGSIQTSSGDVECEDIGGNVRTSSGDVKANDIVGNVNTMSGDIKHRR